MRKQRQVKKTIFVWFIAVSLAAVLSACGKEEAEKAEERAFGVDYSGQIAIQFPEQVICGQENAWVITTAKNDFIYRVPYDTHGVGMEQIAWQPKEGTYYMKNIAERDGILYAEFYNQEEDTFEVRKYQKNTGWNEVMSVKPEDDGWNIMGSGFFVDSSENVYLVSGNIVTRFEGEGKQVCEYELKGDICTFQESGEGSVLCVTAGKKTIALYELGENIAEEKWTWNGDEAVGQVYGIYSSEEGTLCLTTNEKLLFFDIESGRLRAETNLVKLGVASVLTGYYDAEAGTMRLYGLAGSDTKILYCNLLSGRDASMEQRTELVYGMIGEINARTDSSIWTAITTFNQENENYYITIKNYGGWSNQDRLHADMAAGNGPDIIDMTYSMDVYDSYVKNGYLEDLAPYLEQSQYKDDIIWNVLDAYKIDGGLYMFIPQFYIKGIVVHRDYMDMIEEWNIETFLELIEKNQWEKDIFYSRGNPEKLLYYLLCGMQEEFIDWEQGEASFETEEFMDMLALCREYAEAGASEWTAQDGTTEQLYQEMGCSGFENGIFLSEIYGLSRDCPIYGFPTLSGQVYGVEASYDGCAVYAGSKNKEGAWEFIESLLWDSNQKNTGMANTGYPIRNSILKESEEGITEIEYKVNNNEPMKITETEIKIQEDIIYNGKLVNASILIDSDIWAVVQEETAAYFTGDKSAEDVAHIIQSRVGIILKE